MKLWIIDFNPAEVNVWIVGSQPPEYKKWLLLNCEHWNIIQLNEGPYPRLLWITLPTFFGGPFV